MLALYRTLSLRYLRLRWGLNVLVVLSIGLGVAIWVATSALYVSLEQSILVSLNPLAGFADLQISNGDAGVPADLKPRLAAIPGVKTVRPVVVDTVRIILGDNTLRPAMLIGMELPTGGDADPGPSDVRVSGLDHQAAGYAMLFGPPPALIGGGLSAALPPGTKRLKIWAADATHEVTRIGTVEAGGPLASLGGNVLLMEYSAAARLIGQPGRVSRIDLVLAPGAVRGEVASAVRAELSASGEGQVRTPEADDNRIREQLAPLKVGALIVSAGALVVGMFLVYNTLSVSVAERRHDIGVLRSVGATRDQVSRLFLGEALLLGLLGSLIGIPLGLGLARLLLGPIGAMVNDALGTVPMHVPPLADLRDTLLSALAAGVTTSMAAALAPALGAAREEPADAVRRLPRSAGLSARVLQLVACLLLASLGMALIAGRNHVAEIGTALSGYFELPAWKRAGMFGGIGCIFVAAFLAIALFSALCSRLMRPLAQWVFPIEGRLSADNLVRAPGRTGLVIAALAACVALMAHTAGITRSNEAAVMGWLERAVTADLIVSSGGPVSSTGQTMPMKETVARRIEQLIPGARVVPITWRSVEWPHDGQDVQIVVAAVDAGAYYAANQERGAAVPQLGLFRRLAEEPGTAVMSENLAALFGIKVGDAITVQGVAAPVRLEIIGAIEDYAAPRGLVLLHRDHYPREFDTKLVHIIDVYLPAGADAATIESARVTLAQSPLAAEHALVVLTGDEVRHNIIALIRRLYSLGYLQELVVGIVAALGVVAALVISIIQRRRELGLLRALGATQGQVLRTVLFEALLMGLIGSALGVVFGLLLEWYAVDVILFEESGFRFPMIVPWREAGIISALAVVTAALAGLLPALRAVRLRIADAIAYE
jgi:putative ABC transport system permease protein